ncbi:hypothetical protein BGX20_006512 [Mortierella sp. AD010]|nr:hypothetical protein BGX20_006512 [Mortierella sp. AD010]
MALIQSLAMSAAGSRLLRDGNDTMEQVAARGISYILFYAIFGNLVRWSYGFSLLVPKDAEEQTVFQEHQEVTEYTREQVQPVDGVLVNVDEPQPVLPQHMAAASSASSMRTLGDESDEADEEEPINGHNHSNFFRSAHKLKSQKLSTHMQQLSPPVVRPTREFQTLLSSHQRHRRHSHHRRRSARSLIKQKASTAFDRIRQVMTPPLLTAIIALVIGLIPALHKFFMGYDSKFYSFIIHPIENCGAAAIPMILLCLGAQVEEISPSGVVASIHHLFSPMHIKSANPVHQTKTIRIKDGFACKVLRGETFMGVEGAHHRTLIHLRQQQHSYRVN